MKLSEDHEKAASQLADLFIQRLGVKGTRRVGPRAAMSDVRLDIPDLDFAPHNELQLAEAAYELVSSSAELEFHEIS